MLAHLKKLSLRSLLDIVTSVTLIGAASVLIYKNVFILSGAQSELQAPSEPVSLDGAHLRGSKDARTVMIVFSDFECPFCARFEKEVFPQIDQRYIATGRVALAFRHLPLSIHSQARRAATVAECAGRQGKFWEMHDRLFAEKSLTSDSLQAIPQSLNLDQNTFDVCLRDGEIAKIVEASVAEADALGIQSTPAFFFGRITDDGRVSILDVLAGARPINEFVERLDAMLGEERHGWRSWIPFG